MSIIKRKARDIYYDNSDSGLTADDVKEAIDELDSDITAEDLWDRDTTGDPFITQHTAGDDVKVKDSSDNDILFVDTSDASVQNGRTDQDSVLDVNDASQVSQAKLNSIGVGYHMNHFGFGTKTSATMLSVNGSYSGKRTALGAADYNPSILTEDFLLAVDNTAAPRTVTISTEDIQSGSTSNPRIWVVKDESLNAGVNNITVKGETGTIDGAATFVMTNNGQAIKIYSDGTNLFII